MMFALTLQAITLLIALAILAYHIYTTLTLNWPNPDQVFLNTYKKIKHEQQNSILPR